MNQKRIPPGQRQVGDFPVLDLGIRPAVTHGTWQLTLHGYDDYTTNLPLSALLDDDVLVAHSFEDAPLADEHGGPVRLMVPKRYGWKSEKWLRAIEFHTEDRPGYREVRGYHNEAAPWKEERYSND